MEFTQKQPYRVMLNNTILDCSPDILVSGIIKCTVSEANPGSYYFSILTPDQQIVLQTHIQPLTIVNHATFVLASTIIPLSRNITVYAHSYISQLYESSLFCSFDSNQFAPLEFIFENATLTELACKPYYPEFTMQGEEHTLELYYRNKFTQNLTRIPLNNMETSVIKLISRKSSCEIIPKYEHLNASIEANFSIICSQDWNGIILITINNSTIIKTTKIISRVWGFSHKCTDSMNEVVFMDKEITLGRSYFSCVKATNLTVKSTSLNEISLVQYIILTTTSNSTSSSNAIEFTVRVAEMNSTINNGLYLTPWLKDSIIGVINSTWKIPCRGFLSEEKIICNSSFDISKSFTEGRTTLVLGMTRSTATISTMSNTIKLNEEFMPISNIAYFYYYPVSIAIADISPKMIYEGSMPSIVKVFLLEKLPKFLLSYTPYCVLNKLNQTLNPSYFYLKASKASETTSFQSISCDLSTQNLGTGNYSITIGFNSLYPQYSSQEVVSSNLFLRVLPTITLQLSSLSMNQPLIKIINDSRNSINLTVAKWQLIDAYPIYSIFTQVTKSIAEITKTKLSSTSYAIQTSCDKVLSQSAYSLSSNSSITLSCRLPQSFNDSSSAGIYSLKISQISISDFAASSDIQNSNANYFVLLNNIEINEVTPQLLNADANDTIIFKGDFSSLLDLINLENNAKINVGIGESSSTNSTTAGTVYIPSNIIQINSSTIMFEPIIKKYYDILKPIEEPINIGYYYQNGKIASQIFKVNFIFNNSVTNKSSIITSLNNATSNITIFPIQGIAHNNPQYYFHSNLQAISFLQLTVLLKRSMFLNELNLVQDKYSCYLVDNNDELITITNLPAKIVKLQSLACTVPIYPITNISKAKTKDFVSYRLAVLPSYMKFNPETSQNFGILKVMNGFTLKLVTPSIAPIKGGTLLNIILSESESNIYGDWKSTIYGTCGKSIILYCVFNDFANYKTVAKFTSSLNISCLAPKMSKPGKYKLFISNNDSDITSSSCKILSNAIELVYVPDITTMTLVQPKSLVFNQLSHLIIAPTTASLSESIEFFTLTQCQFKTVFKSKGGNALYSKQYARMENNSFVCDFIAQYTSTVASIFLSLTQNDVDFSEEILLNVIDINKGSTNVTEKTEIIEPDNKYLIDSSILRALKNAPIVTAIVPVHSQSKILTIYGSNFDIIRSCVLFNSIMQRKLILTLLTYNATMIQCISSSTINENSDFGSVFGIGVFSLSFLLMNGTEYFPKMLATNEFIMIDIKQLPYISEISPKYGVMAGNYNVSLKFSSSLSSDYINTKFYCLFDNNTETQGIYINSINAVTCIVPTISSMVNSNYVSKVSLRATTTSGLFSGSTLITSVKSLTYVPTIVLSSISPLVVEYRKTIVYDFTLTGAGFSTTIAPLFCKFTSTYDCFSNCPLGSDSYIIQANAISDNVILCSIPASAIIRGGQINIKLLLDGAEVASLYNLNSFPSIYLSPIISQYEFIQRGTNTFNPYSILIMGANLKPIGNALTQIFCNANIFYKNGTQQSHYLSFAGNSSYGLCKSLDTQLIDLETTITLFNFSLFWGNSLSSSVPVIANLSMGSPAYGALRLILPTTISSFSGNVSIYIYGAFLRSNYQYYCWFGDAVYFEPATYINSSCLMCKSIITQGSSQVLLKVTAGSFEKVIISGLITFADNIISLATASYAPDFSSIEVHGSGFDQSCICKIFETDNSLLSLKLSSTLIDSTLLRCKLPASLKSIFAIGGVLINVYCKNDSISASSPIKISFPYYANDSLIAYFPNIIREDTTINSISIDFPMNTILSSDNLNYASKIAVSCKYNCTSTLIPTPTILQSTASWIINSPQLTPYISCAIPILVWQFTTGDCAINITLSSISDASNAISYTLNPSLHLLPRLQLHSISPSILRNDNQLHSILLIGLNFRDPALSSSISYFCYVNSLLYFSADYINSTTLRCEISSSELLVSQGLTTIDIKICENSTARTNGLYYSNSQSITIIQTKPIIDEVSPRILPMKGGITITITGQNFVNDLTYIIFASSLIVKANVISSSQATIISPVFQLSHLLPTAFIKLLPVVVSSSSLSENEILSLIDTSIAGQYIKLFPLPVLISANTSLIYSFGSDTIALKGQNLTSDITYTCKFNYSDSGTQKTQEVSSTFISEEMLLCNIPNSWAIPEGAIQLRLSVQSSSLTDCFSVNSISLNGIAQMNVIKIDPTSASKKGGTIISVYASKVLSSSSDNLNYCKINDIVDKAIQVDSLNNIVYCAVPFITTTGTVVVEIMNERGEFTNSKVQLTVTDEIWLNYISPTLGPSSGGTLITIYGMNFIDTIIYSCKFSLLSLNETIAPFSVAATRIDQTTLTCSSPQISKAGIYAIVTIIIVSGTGNEAITGSAEYYYYLKPTITSIYPKAGIMTGGTAVEIIGTGLIKISQIYCKFGTNAPVIASILVEGEKIKCLTPASTVYQNVALSVSLDNILYITAADQFYYYHQPMFLQTEPKTRYTLGYDWIVISGAGFFSLTNLQIICRFTFKGCDSAVIDYPATYIDATTIKCPSPPYAECSGTYIDISFNSGFEFFTACQELQYLRVPEVTSLLPMAYSSYLSSPSANIFGVSFPSDAVAYFSHITPVTAVNVGYLSSNQLSVTIPPYYPPSKLISKQILRTVITVAKLGGNIGLSKIAFTYIWRPTISKISPTSGSITGGTIITIYGSDFMNVPNLKCYFGDLIASTVIFISVNQTTCVSPAVAAVAASGATNYIIKLSFDGGYDNITMDNPMTATGKQQFYYYLVPTINSISPTFAFFSAINIEIKVEVLNIISNYDRLTCKINNLLFASSQVFTDGGKTYVKCFIYSYLAVISSWDFSSDISIPVEISMNGFEFSSSGLTFMFINQLNLISTISPIKGPKTGSTEVHFALRRNLDFSSVVSTQCWFGDSTIAGSYSKKADNELVCISPAATAIISANKPITCYNFYFCIITAGITINEYTWKYLFIYYQDPSISLLLPYSSAGNAAPTLLIQGTDLYSFYYLAYAKFTFSVGTPTIFDCVPVDFNTTVKCMPSLLSGNTIPSDAKVEISYNKQNWMQSQNGPIYFTFNNEDAVVSLSPLSGPCTGKTKIVIKYSNIYSTGSDPDRFRCKFTYSAGSASRIVPATWNSQASEISCLSPSAVEIIDTIPLDASVTVQISSNSKDFSQSALLQFNYYPEAVFTSIDNPYYICDIVYLRTITGVFPVLANNALISPIIKLVKVIGSDGGTPKEVTISPVSYSANSITFNTVSNIFVFSDTIEIFLSLNNGYTYQKSPIYLKAIPAGTLYQALPNNINLNTLTTVTITGDKFINMPFVCSIDGVDVVAVRITSEKILCTLPSSSVGKTTTVTVKVDQGYMYAKDPLSITYQGPPVIISLSPSLLFSGKPYTITVTGTGLSNGAKISFNEFIYHCSSASKLDTECTFNLSPLPEGNYEVRIAQKSQFFSIPFTPISITGCDYKTSSCPNYYNSYSDPVQCGIGYFCTDISLLQQQCPIGYYQDQTGQSSCKICPSNSYCPYPALSSPLSCPPGYLCLSQGLAFKDEMSICPEGFYCPSGTDNIDKTKADTSPGNNMKTCPIGYWCGLGTISGTSIFRNFYTPQPCHDSIVCSAGSNDPRGSGSCEKGYYCVSGSKTACPAGTFCPFDSMTKALACPLGLFNSQTDPPGALRTQCIPCPLGTQCQAEGATTPYKCKPGFVCSISGQIVPSYLCPGGSYCAGGVVTNMTTSPLPDRFKPLLCSPGTYCLNGTRTNQIIPGDAGAAQNCMEGFYCRWGTDSPQGSGYCPEGYYCPYANTTQPIPASPGYFASGRGNVNQEPCPPGTYSQAIAATSCSPCPAGYYCPTQCMTKPIACPIGTYRELDVNTVYCTNCPEGTWSNVTTGVSVQACISCSAGIVCDKEGMTNVTAQSRLCPEGFVCPSGTTSYTENSFPCPAGFYCGKGTGSVSDYYLCQQGYYCPEGATESSSISHKCPSGYYCPQATAANITAGGMNITLYSIKNTAIYNLTVAAWKNKNINIVNETACDSIDASIPSDLKATYSSLQCPKGTTSSKGSYCLGHCIVIETSKDQGQINPVIGGSNIVPNTTSNGTASNSTQTTNSTSKTRLLAGTIMTTNVTINESLVEYLLLPMQMAEITLNCSALPKELVYNDIYQLTIYNGNNTEIDMPSFFDQSNPENITKNNSKLLKVRVINISINNHIFKVGIKLLNLLYSSYTSYFHKIVNVTIKETNRALYNTRNIFGVFLYQKTVDGLSLPYNFNDMSSDLFLDFVSTDSDISLVKKSYERDPFDTTLWQSMDQTVIPHPWLPFFSCCKGQDRRVLLWDLLENSNNCSLIDAKDTHIVSKIPTDGFSPKSDKCNIQLDCMYEEDLNVSGPKTSRWFQITAPTALFYVSSYSMTANDLMNNLDDIKNKFAKGSDEFVAATFNPAEGTKEGVPTEITIEIKYYQKTQEEKIITQVTGTFNNYVDYTKSGISRPSYKLIISFTPMDFFELVNAFQFDISIYVLIFCLVSLLLILGVIIFWIINILIMRLSTPPFIRIKHMIQVTFLPPITGGIISIIPVVVVVLIVANLAENIIPDPTASWDLLGTAITSDETEKNRRGRTGLAFIVFAGILYYPLLLFIVSFLKFGASLLISKIQEKEELVEKMNVQKREESLHPMELSEKPEEDMPSRTMYPDPNKAMQEWTINDITQRMKEKMDILTAIDFKQSHFFKVCILVGLALLVKIELAYTEVFQNNIILFLIMLMMLDIIFEQILVRLIMGEALLVSPINGAFVFSELIMTLGAKNFQSFMLSFCVETTVMVVTRIYIDPFIERLIHAFYSLMLRLSEKSKLIDKIFHNILREYLITKKQTPKMAASLSSTKQGLETLLSSVSAYTSQTQALFVSPVMLFLIMWFPDETQYPQNFGIRKSDFQYYFIFSLVIIIPQLIVNIFLLHTLEIVHGMKLYDYFTFAAYRYKNRLSNWIGEQKLDRSIGQAWRSLDNMCFSSQFYFAITIATWGLLFLILGFTMIIKNSYTPFQEPYIVLLIVTLMIMSSLADFILQQGIRSLHFWDANRKDALAQEDKLAIITSPLDHFVHERNLLANMKTDLFKYKFLSKNKDWLINNLPRLLRNEGPEGERIALRIVYEAQKNYRMMMEGEKLKRDRAVLPYNKTDLIERRQSVNAGKAEPVSDISESDYNSEIAMVKRKTKRLFQAYPETIQARILRMWYYKAVESLFFQQTLEAIHRSHMDSKCKICLQKFRLRVLPVRSIDELMNEYKKEMIGVPINERHWNDYYEAHQEFQTLCAECMYVHNLMKKELNKCTYIINKRKNWHFERLTKVSTYKILNLWWREAKKKLSGGIKHGTTESNNLNNESNNDNENKQSIESSGED